MLLLAFGCSPRSIGVRRPDDGPGTELETATDTSADAETAPPPATGDTATAAPCPADMALVADACLDRYEAPNIAGEPPLVMFTLVEAEAWCGARAKRLCTDQEWQRACEGSGGWDYPYGTTHQPGRCNDEQIWRVYDQSRLNGWPPSASAADVTSLDDLLGRAGTLSATAADEVAGLYQGEGGGDNAGCTGGDGVYDLVGNAEEWTVRADGGDGGLFTGALKGRYWAESRTCQSAVTTHGNTFRFYEIGFRCCRDPEAG